MISSSTQAMMNALVGLTRLESQVNHTLRQAGDPAAQDHTRLLSQKALLKVEEVSDATAQAIRENTLDIEA